MRLNVGRIGRAHGILGEATIEVRTDEPQERFAIGSRLETDSHGFLTVVSARVHNGVLLLGFEGVGNRNEIEKYRDALLYADVDIDAPSEEEDDYHVLQLIGSKALLVDGDHYGVVKDVLNLPGQDVLVIETESGESMIPFVRQLVPVVNIKDRTMTVIPPEIDEAIE